MKTTTESIINQVPAVDIPEIRKSLREMMDSHFLQSEGNDTESAYAAYVTVDKLLETIHSYKTENSQVSKVTG
jgi:uncharacterized protein YpbB